MQSIADSKQIVEYNVSGMLEHQESQHPREPQHARQSTHRLQLRDHFLYFTLEMLVSPFLEDLRDNSDEDAPVNYDR